MQSFQATETENLADGGAIIDHPAITGQTVISRRTALRGGLAGVAGLGGLLLFPGQLLASQAVPKAAVDSSFVILLRGIYQPVVHAPNLGLSTVDLNDGSYSTVPIYPVSGSPGNQNTNQPIGDFYVQFAGDLCAYHIAGGSFVMRFLQDTADYHNEDDGRGGIVAVGTIDLTILEATGIYQPFVGGRNHMVDRLDALAPGDGSGGYDELCFCNISQS